MERCIAVMADEVINREEQEEFLELIKAVPMELEACVYQTLKEISFRTYIGKGKCEEIRELMEEHPVSVVIFDHDLTPLQIRNLEDVLQTPVMDHTELILSIFENRAVSLTSRLQVEQARLAKLLPRLIGANAQLGRQSGSGKNKGTGEKQLELDRRVIKQRIAEVKRELKKVEQQRMTQRRSRQKSKLPLVSLVGYTNAGKSTVMNKLLSYSQAKDHKLVLEQDMLFATLDTSIRHIKLANGDEFLLSDTVGFVNKLPHTLIKAFSSTLEEVTYASLLLQVVDASNEHQQQQISVTQKTLQEIEAAHIPMITIYNKCDQTDFHYPMRKANALYMSAREDSGFEELFTMIHEALHPKESEVDLLLPYADSYHLGNLLQNGTLIDRRDEEDGMHLHMLLSEELLKHYQTYLKQ